MNTFDVHTHVDPDVLHQGCDACINRVRADQRAALIEAAPRRRVTWHATYQLEVEGDHLEIAFSLDVKVPAGWTGEQVDDEYASLTGEAFTMALPDSYTYADIEWAIVTFRLLPNIEIGPIVPDGPVGPTPVLPSLFESTAL